MQLMNQCIMWMNVFICTLNERNPAVVIVSSNVFELLCNLSMSHKRKGEVLDKRRTDMWSNEMHHRCSLPSAGNK